VALYKFEDGKIQESTSDVHPFINSPVEIPTGNPGVFTTNLVKDRVPVFIEDHIERLFRNANSIGLQIDRDTRKSIEDIIDQVIVKGDNREYGIRSVLWNLYKNHEFDIKQDFTLYPFNFGFRDEWYYDGISVSLFGWPREQAHVKSILWTTSLDSERWAQKKGSKEAILVDSDGIVYEGTRSNVFWIYKEVVETPSTGILKGVTRKKILDICGKEGIIIVEGTYNSNRLLDAEEVFLTGTTKRVMPVVKINNATIGTGKPGKLTRFLMEEYNNLVENYITEHRK